MSDRDHPREYGENLLDHDSHFSHRGSSPRIRGECAFDGCADAHAGIIPANTGRITLSSAATTCGRDHPREYGENVVATQTLRDRGGSSPRIRGECVKSKTSYTRARIIPANTGRIVDMTKTPPHGWDHPREYGENLSWTRACARVAGSSPRIRGELTTLKNWFQSTGIIPANTGRMRAPVGRRTLLRDHPREYGENKPSHQAAL